MNLLKRTALFPTHQNLGARLVDFGGWEMPVQYTGIVDEHLAVRRAAGIFDISHMGQVTLVGDGAGAFLNRVLTNDLGRLRPGQGHYTLLCNPQGGVVDDLYVFRLKENEYRLILNASRVAADLAWLQSQRRILPVGAAFELHELMLSHAAVALQGPAAAAIVSECLPEHGERNERRLVDLQKNEILPVVFRETVVHVARTGYTGEDGFELFAPATRLEPLWTLLLKTGQGCGLKPCGLGARDTLRTEMGYPLYGHELDETTTPFEAGLGRFVALDKGGFVGREKLLQQKQDGVARKCVAFVMTGSSPPPRPDYLIWGASDQPVGRVVSGTQSPSLGKGIGLGYVPVAEASPATLLEIEIRARRYPAAVVAKPIYRREL